MDSEKDKTKNNGTEVEKIKKPRVNGSAKQRRIQQIVNFFRQFPKSSFTVGKISENVPIDSENPTAYISNVIRHEINSNTDVFVENGLARGKPAYRLGSKADSLYPSQTVQEKIIVDESIRSVENDAKELLAQGDDDQIKQESHSDPSQDVSISKRFKKVFDQFGDMETNPFTYCSLCFAICEMDQLIKCNHLGSCDRCFHPECINLKQTKGLCLVCIDSGMSLKDKTHQYCCKVHNCSVQGCLVRPQKECLFCCTAYCQIHENLTTINNVQMCPKCVKLNEEK